MLYHCSCCLVEDRRQRHSLPKHKETNTTIVQSHSPPKAPCGNMHVNTHATHLPADFFKTLLQNTRSHLPIAPSSYIYIIPNSLPSVHICPSTTPIHRTKAPAIQTSHSKLSPNIINFSVTKKILYFQNSLRPFSTCLAGLCSFTQNHSF